VNRPRFTEAYAALCANGALRDAQRTTLSLAFQASGQFLRGVQRQAQRAEGVGFAGERIYRKSRFCAWAYYRKAVRPGSHPRHPARSANPCIHPGNRQDLPPAQWNRI